MKKRLSLIGIIAMVIVVFVAITLAYVRWNSSTNTNVNLITKGMDAYIIYEKGTDVLSSANQQLLPTSSYTGGISTTIELWKSASAPYEIYGHIYLDITTIGNIVKTEPALKWAIVSNNKVLNTGNFIGYNTNDSIPLVLNIPLKTTRQTFTIYIWLDESMDINLDIEGETISTIVRAEATQEPYYIEPNAPELVEGLIPITYYNNAWVKADTTNTSENYKWYDYPNKKWANAVLVSSTNRSTYSSASAGTTISSSDILAYYVWIPRYKYKVWNINKVVGTDSYNARTTGIDILFEEGTNSTGTITCGTYSFAQITSDSQKSETCTGESTGNGEYYTHPAFIFGEDELTGIWVGKFEISSGNPSASNGGGNSTALTVRVLPNVTSWRYNSLTNFYKVIYDMQTSSNIYGLSTDRTNTDSHMMKNLEWGAVAYLTNSEYGRCTNSACTEVTINNNSSYLTGGGDYANNVLQSTTGNIYGIYDLNGGSWEYMMGNISQQVYTGYTYYPSSAGSNFTYTGNEKYIDTYAYGTTNNSQQAHNRARLGDATGEIVLASSGGWYSDYFAFPSSSTSWFLRGGYYSDGSAAGVFAFGTYSGIYIINFSSRAVLVAP